MRSLKSITKIKDCPSFIDFKSSSLLPEFGKYNLIYGWNGSGKTTLSRILRSFELEKNYFNNPASPSQFELKLDDGTSINNENLSGYKEIRVFNKDFVDDSVFCAAGPKPLFYLGKESKESKEKITEDEASLILLNKDLISGGLALEKSIDNKEKSLSLKAREIKNALTTTKQDKYRNYDKTSIETSLISYAIKLETPDNLVLSDEKLLATQKAIQQTSKDKITSISLVNVDISTEVFETNALLSKTITSKVIESLKSDEEISRWIERGLGIHKERSLVNCAFCEQLIPAYRISDLENHFNLEYQKTLEEIKSLRELLHSRKISKDFPDSSSLYEDLSAEYILEKSKAEIFVEEFNSNIDLLLTALDEKQKNLFKNPSIATLKILDNEPFKLVNEIIIKHNLKTDNFESQISNEKETLELHYLGNFVTSYNEMIKISTTLDSEQKALTKTVGEKAAEVKKLKEGLISHHIPAQKINEDLEKFLGRADIQIKAVDALDGYQITRNGVTAKDLSEGEETALAVVYFLAKIKEDGFDIKNGTIVIDDPISSLDSNSIFLAFSFIKESIKDAGQIIVLTHHFDFFRQVKNWFKYMSNGPHKETSSYFMTVCKSDAGVRKSNLIKLDKLLLDFESEYHFIFNILYCFSKKSQEELSEIYSLPNTARKFLESFLAFRVPITVGVTNIDARLAHIDFDTVKKTRINRFVQTHSHPRYEAGIQDFDMSLLGEAQEVVADILSMVKNEDERHYNHLVKSVDPGSVPSV